jgi:tRNA G18 (ribose-2'-O)-methylase SpoU
MPIERIDTANDSRLDPYRSLPAHDAKRRDAPFVVETREVVRQLLTSRRFAVQSVLLTESARAALAEHLERRPELRVYLAPLPVLKHVVGFDFHRGCLALGDRGVEPPLDEVLAPRPPRLVLLEEASNPDNVGGVLRVARALGGDAVLLSAGCCDPLYRKTVRVSMGAALTVPWARIAAWEAALARLRAAGYTLIALTSRGETDVAALGATLPVPARAALLVGAEGQGLRPTTLAAADFRLRIPMAEGVDSLNLVTACAVALDRLGGARTPV